MTHPTDPIRQAVAELSAAKEGAPIPVNAQEIFAAVSELTQTVPITQHPLGFMHFELSGALDVSPRERVRLHVWSEVTRGWQDQLGNVHSHTWRLNSLVLVGALRDTTFEASESESGDWIASEVVYEVGGPTSRSTGRLYTLTATMERDIVAMHSYQLEPGILHGSKPLSLPTATLLHAQESGTRSVLVFRNRAVHDSEASPRAPVDPSIAADTLRVLIDSTT
jgi:hypothetical protein